MTWRVDDPQGEESLKIFELLVPYTRGRGLDVGCGKKATFPHMTGVDDGKDYGGARVTDIKAEADDLPFKDGSQDFVFSSHCLEHMEDYRATLKEWWRVLKPGGHLALYLPHRDFYPNIGQIGSNPDHRHDFHPDDIKAAMREVAPDWTLVEDEERGQDREYSFFQVYRREAEGAGQAEKPWRRREKSCLVVRYGAFGDTLQAASVLPALKAEGWHITFNTSARGHDMARHDPHVDAFLVQDEGQVPERLLGEYWKRLAKRYDRVVNLCESVEGTLLPEKNRVAFFWPDDVRRKVMNANYVEFIHTLAQVPMPPRVHFYETGEEQAKARLKRDATARGLPFVMICATGSSVHKRYPYLPDLIGLMLKHANVAFVTVGDATAAEYETSSAFAVLKCWTELQPEQIEAMTLDERVAAIHRLPGIKGRWLPLAGKMAIRDTLALAKQSDVVFGPETGVLNAVSMLPRVHKVVMLSHSSHTNLTRDWESTIAITPKVPCYPCHRLHRDHEFCPQDPETQVAICTTIPVEGIFNAIMAQLQEKRRQKGLATKVTPPRPAPDKPAVIAAE